MSCVVVLVLVTFSTRKQPYPGCWFSILYVLTVLTLTMFCFRGAAETITIRDGDDKHGGVTLIGAEQPQATDYDALMHVFEEGVKRRSVGE